MQLLNVALAHEVEKAFLEGAHIGSVHVTCVHVDFSLLFVLVTLSVLDVSIVKDSVGVVYGTKEIVKVVVHGLPILLLPRLRGRFVVCDVLKFHQVLWEDESVIENEPKSLLGVIFLGPKDGLDALLAFEVNRGISPYFRW
jgi:hypothetical protein